MELKVVHPQILKIAPEIKNKINFESPQNSTLNPQCLIPAYILSLPRKAKKKRKQVITWIKKEF
jgi:hypothetical protein